MIRLPAISMIAVALSAMVLVLARADAAEGVWRCAGSFGPRGEPGQGFWHDIRVTRQSNVRKRQACRTARRVLRAYLPPSGTGPVRVRVRVRGKLQVYRCRLETDRDPSQGTLAHCVRLSGKRVVVTAIGQP
jgi:hypothetical protein